MKRNSDLQIDLPTDCVCVPPSPFYVRWLNRFGGVDYWLFSVRQELGAKLGAQELFVPYLYDPGEALGTEYALKKQVGRTVVVGAELLTENEWHELSVICASPRVQWFEESERKWYDCVVEKSDNDCYTDEVSHAVELTLRLPAFQVQY